MLQSLGDVRLGARRTGAWPAAELGLLERWYAAQPTPRVAGFVLELARPVAEPTLNRALTELRKRHADALAVTLVGARGRSPRFVPCTAELPFARAREADAWTCAARALHTPFVDAGPLWRLTATNTDTCVIGTFHHAIADGVSVSIFVRELLALLRGESLSAIPGRRLPLDARLDLRPPLRLLMQALRTEGRSTPFFRGPDPVQNPRSTQLFPVVLRAMLVRALATRARRERASVHAVLCAAGLVASASAASRPGFPLCARLSTPISLRRYASPQPTGMGVFLCGLESDHRLEGSERFWRLAEAYTRRLRTALPESYQRVGLLRFAGRLDARAEELSRAPNARTATLEVSNLGRVTGVGDARLWFMQGNHYHGPLFNLSVATCAESGELRATLAVPTPVVDVEQAKRFLHVFERVLAGSVDGEHTLKDALRW